MPFPHTHLDCFIWFQDSVSIKSEKIGLVMIKLIYSLYTQHINITFHNVCDPVSCPMLFPHTPWLVLDFHVLLKCSFSKKWKAVSCYDQTSTLFRLHLCSFTYKNIMHSILATHSLFLLFCSFFIFPFQYLLNLYPFFLLSLFPFFLPSFLPPYLSYLFEIWDCAEIDFYTQTILLWWWACFDLHKRLSVKKYYGNRPAV